MMCLAILKTWKKILDLDLAIPNVLEESESTVDYPLLLIVPENLVILL